MFKRWKSASGPARWPRLQVRGTVACYLLHPLKARGEEDDQKHMWPRQWFHTAEPGSGHSPSSFCFRLILWTPGAIRLLTHHKHDMNLSSHSGMQPGYFNSESTWFCNVRSSPCNPQRCNVFQMEPKDVGRFEFNSDELKRPKMV